MAFDPMQMMMLMQGAQGFTDNFSAARRGVQPPQQGGGMQEMVPMMAMMQRGQAANAEMELERQKFAAAQQAAQQRSQMLEQAAKDMGVPLAVVASNPDAVITAYADRLKAQKLGAGDQLYVGGEKAAENPALLQAEYGGVFDPRSGGFAANPEMQQFDLAKARAGAANTNVSVSPTAIYGATQGAFDKKIYEAAGDAYVGMQKEAEASRKMAEDFRQIDSLLGETPTGQGFDQWRLKFAKAAQGIGIPVDAEAIATKETAESLVNQFALGARSPDGPLGGLPGATSDRDIEFLRSIPPGIEQTPAGRKLMVEAQAAKAEHRSARAQAARQYIQGRNGEVDPVELDAFKAAYDKEHPIFTGLADKWQGKFGPQPQSGGGSTGAATDVPAHLQKYFTGP